KTNFFVDWSKDAKIEKSKDNKKIIISHNGHSIKFQLDDVGYLFDLKAAYRKYIKEGTISEELRDGFYQNKIFLPTKAKIKKIKDGEWRAIWNRTDGMVDIYTIKDLRNDTDESIKIYCEGRVFVENEDKVKEILVIRKKAGELLVYDNPIILENIVASISINLNGINSEYIHNNRLNIENIVEKDYMNIFTKATKENANIEESIAKIINKEYSDTFKKAMNEEEIDEEKINKNNIEKITEIFRKIIRKAIEEGEIEKVIAPDAIIFLYNKSRFPGIVYRLKDLQLAMLLFDSGSIICTGAGREEFVQKAKNCLIEKLKEFDINLNSEPIIELQNIVASTMFYPKINLDIFADYDENTEYEPEQFPGLIYKIAEPKTVMLVFRSGRIVVTGAKSVDFAIEASKMTKKAIMDAKALIYE
ncbi:MAG: hypothetical protein QMD06_05025, partial [Candidatus Altarchaeum sp.]|nr:hypothetical protein [Candidatus Altarchaeum sp.]